MNFGKVRKSNVRLDEEQVSQVKVRLLTGEVQRTIAADFDVCDSTISRINCNYAGRHIEPFLPEPNIAK